MIQAIQAGIGAAMAGVVVMVEEEAGATDRLPPSPDYFGASTISIWRPSMRG